MKSILLHTSCDLPCNGKSQIPLCLSNFSASASPLTICCPNTCILHRQTAHWHFSQPSLLSPHLLSSHHHLMIFNAKITIAFLIPGPEMSCEARDHWFPFRSFKIRKSLFTTLAFCTCGPDGMKIKPSLCCSDPSMNRQTNSGDQTKNPAHFREQQSIPPASQSPPYSDISPYTSLAKGNSAPFSFRYAMELVRKEPHLFTSSEV